MKNILLVISLFAFFNSYATDPLSWGKKGGSGGVTQSQLDQKADTSQILEGQEALDTLSSMISKTVHGLDAIAVKASISGGDAVCASNSYYSIYKTSTTATDNRLNLSYGVIEVDTVLKGLRIPIQVALVYTAEDFNGVALFKVNATEDSVECVAVSASDANVFKTVGYQDLDFTSPYSASAGQYMFATILSADGSGFTTPGALRCSAFGYNELGGTFTRTHYYKTGVTSVTVGDKYAIADLSTNTGADIIVIGYGE